MAPRPGRSRRADQPEPSARRARAVPQRRRARRAAPRAALQSLRARRTSTACSSPGRPASSRRSTTPSATSSSPRRSRSSGPSGCTPTSARRPPARPNGSRHGRSMLGARNLAAITPYYLPGRAAVARRVLPADRRRRRRRRAPVRLPLPRPHDDRGHSRAARRARDDPVGRRRQDQRGADGAGAGVPAGRARRVRGLLGQRRRVRGRRPGGLRRAPCRGCRAPSREPFVALRDALRRGDERRRDGRPGRRAAGGRRRRRERRPDQDGAGPARPAGRAAPRRARPADARTARQRSPRPSRSCVEPPSRPTSRTSRRAPGAAPRRAPGCARTRRSCRSTASGTSGGRPPGSPTAQWGTLPVPAHWVLHGLRDGHCPLRPSAVHQRAVPLPDRPAARPRREPGRRLPAHLRPPGLDTATRAAALRRRRVGVPGGAQRDRGRRRQGQPARPGVRRHRPAGARPQRADGARAPVVVDELRRGPGPVVAAGDLPRRHPARPPARRPGRRVAAHRVRRRPRQRRSRDHRRLPRHGRDPGAGRRAAVRRGVRRGGRRRRPRRAVDGGDPAPLRRHREQPGRDRRRCAWASAPWRSTANGSW